MERSIQEWKSYPIAIWKFSAAVVRNRDPESAQNVSVIFRKASHGSLLFQMNSWLAYRQGNNGKCHSKNRLHIFTKHDTFARKTESFWPKSNLFWESHSYLERFCLLKLCRLMAKCLLKTSKRSDVASNGGKLTKSHALAYRPYPYLWLGFEPVLHFFQLVFFRQFLLMVRDRRYMLSGWRRRLHCWFSDAA